MTTHIEPGGAEIVQAQARHRNATPQSKAALLEKLLVRPRGATMAELMGATDWQNHSVPAFLSGLRKKGHVLIREARKTGDVAYRSSAGKSAVPADTDVEVA